MTLDFKTVCDYLAPVICVQHGVSHLGCIFAGCCCGYEWQYGVWNYARRCYTFPIQPIEALVAIGIVLFIWLKEKKIHFKVTGKFYPLMLILFGYTRFLLEFARDNDKLFLGISNLAIHALIMAYVGTQWYLYLTMKEKRQKGTQRV